MKEFIHKYADRIHGVLSCFDRMLFRGYPQLLSHSTLCFGAREVMNFLGRKLNGNLRGEVVSDLSSFACRRVGGSRIKHRVKQNWLKMYDKAGQVLRIETVINNPGERPQ